MVRPAPVKLLGRKARTFCTTLRREAKAGPNFAGHYTIATWGCGTFMCTGFVEGDCFFALFNPPMTEEEERKEAESGNPTAGITSVRYTDEELTGSFLGFDIVRAATFELGTRGYFLVKHTTETAAEKSPNA